MNNIHLEKERGREEGRERETKIKRKEGQEQDSSLASQSDAANVAHKSAQENWLTAKMGLVNGYLIFVIIHIKFEFVYELYVCLFPIGNC